jgi:hypothetical protein
MARLVPLSQQQPQDEVAIVSHSMNIFGMIGFLLTLALTIFLGRFAFRYIGWWAFVPAGMLGLVLIVMSAVSFWSSLRLVTAQGKRMFERFTRKAPPK